MDIIQKDLNYFRSNLQELLNSDFPEKAYDTNFINKRSNWAFNAYGGALLGKNSEEESEKIANSILFEGLYFSKFNTIFQVVLYEFDTVMVEEELRPFAIKMLNFCEEIFLKYEITDDFVYSTKFDYLYADLKTHISEWLSKNLQL